MKGTGLRLNRDPRARSHPAARLLAVTGDLSPIHVEPRRYVYHRLAPILDQGFRPDCHGFAVRQAANSGPFMQSGGPSATEIARMNCERDARVFGWPLDYDHGATLDSAAATMKEIGWAESYWWTSEGAQGALQALEWVCRGGGVLMATPWLPSMDKPFSGGFVEIRDGEPNMGWHAWYLSGANRESGRWKGPNSWGATWGYKGTFWGQLTGLQILFGMGAYGACVVERRV